MKSRGLLREFTFGATTPRGWAMAWYEPQRRIKVYAPVPIHWLARWGREIWWRIELTVRSPQRERYESQEMQRRIRDSQRFAEEYARGYLAGWRECRESYLEATGKDAMPSRRRILALGDLADLDLFAEGLGSGKVKDQI